MKKRYFFTADANNIQVYFNFKIKKKCYDA